MLDDLLDSLDQTWSQLSERLAGLTVDEYLWEPTSGCWSVRANPDGGVSVDEHDTEADPAPLTTIAWRMWHVAVDCLDSYSSRVFGRTGTGMVGTAWVLDPNEAYVLLETRVAGVPRRRGRRRLGPVVRSRWARDGDRTPKAPCSPSPSTPNARSPTTAPRWRSSATSSDPARPDTEHAVAFGHPAGRRDVEAVEDPAGRADRGAGAEALGGDAPRCPARTRRRARSTVGSARRHRRGPRRSARRSDPPWPAPTAAHARARCWPRRSTRADDTSPRRRSNTSRASANSTSSHRRIIARRRRRRSARRADGARGRPCGSRGCRGRWRDRRWPAVRADRR